MRLILRRVTANVSLLAVSVALVALTAGATAAAARAVAQMTTDGLRAAVSDAGPAVRGLTATRAHAAATATSAHQAGQQFQRELDRPLRDITTDGTTIIDTPRLVAADPVIDGRPRLFTLRIQPDVGRHAEVVTGRLPRPSSERVEVPVELRDAALGTDQRAAPLFEVALTGPTATELHLSVGDTALLAADRDDPYVTRFLTRRPYVAVRVSGIVALDDPDHPVWFGDAAAHAPTLISSPGGGEVTVFATALVAPEALRPLAAALQPIPVVATWRYPVDPELVAARDVRDIRQALRRAEQRHVTTEFVPAGMTGLRTGLGGVLDEFVATRAATLTAVAVAGVGLAGVLIAVVTLLAALRTDMRRDVDTLFRARGASKSQMVVTAALEAVLIGVTGGLLGLAGARSVGDGVGHAIPVGVVGAAVVAGALFTAATPRQTLMRDASSAALRRVVIESTVVGLAVTGVLLVRRRGLVTPGAGVDPFLLAVPVLLGVAVGLTLVRVLPAATGAITEPLARRTSTVAVTGLRRAARQPSATVLPMLAVVLAVATGVLTDAVDHTVSAELDRQAWMEVGAPARSDAPPGETVAADGAGAVAYVQRRVNHIGGGQVTLLAIDAAAYGDVVAGTPIATDLPELGGSAAPPLPALASPDAMGDVGTTGELRLPGTATVPVEVRAVRRRFPSLPAQEPFVIVSYDALVEVVPGGLEPNRRYLRTVVATEGRVVTQAQAAARLRADPLVATGIGAFPIATVLAGGLAAIAVVVSLVLAARARRRDIAHLRMIGLSSRQGVGLLVAEVVPPMIVAIATGLGLGAATVWLVGPALRLGALTTGVPVSPRVDPVSASVGAVVLAAVIIAATVWAGRRGRQIDLAQALRMEE